MKFGADRWWLKTEVQIQLQKASYVAFIRNGVQVFFEKASLIWALGGDGKRISTDRIHRFEGNERAFDSGERILLGDFLEMKYEGKERIVQVLGFRFENGKTYHGDHYSFKRAKEDKKSSQGSAVMVFCNFFKENGTVLLPTSCQQRYVKVENYIAHKQICFEIR